MNPQPPIKDPVFSQLLRWTLTQSPFHREDFAKYWAPNKVFGEQAKGYDPTFHNKLFDDFRQAGWLMENQFGKFYHSSDPICKSQSVRLITCISKVKQIMAQVFENLETSMSLQMKLLTDSTLSIENIQLLSHLKRDTDFQFEVISHLAATLAHIGLAMKALDEEKVAIIETFLQNFWGTPPEHVEASPRPTPNINSPTNEKPQPDINRPQEHKPKTNDTDLKTYSTHTSRKSDPISEDELNDRYQTLMRTHQIDFSRQTDRQPRYPLVGDLQMRSPPAGFRASTPENALLAASHIDRNQPLPVSPNPNFSPNQQPLPQSFYPPLRSTSPNPNHSFF